MQAKTLEASGVTSSASAVAADHELTLTVYPPHRLFIGDTPRRDAHGAVRNFRSPCIGVRVSMAWRDLVRWSSMPYESPSKESQGGFSLARFRDNLRRNDTCESVYAIALDFDTGETSATELARLLSPMRAIVYTTFSSTPEAPRLRGIVACSRPMTPDEYRDVWDYACAFIRHAGLTQDRATRDPARLWYAPAAAHGGHWEHLSHDGLAIDVDEAIREMTRRREVERAAHPPPTRAAASPSHGGQKHFERVQRYVDAIPGAVSGSHGHDATFKVACVIASNVDDEFEQLRLLRTYNARCQPPWSEKALLHKLADARKRPALSPLRGTKIR